MYTEYWNLQRAPFEERLVPDLYFPAAGHQSALLKLRYLVEQRKGIGVLVGEHGLGKSLLTHVFEHHTPEAYVFRLLMPQLSAIDTLAYFAKRLGCCPQAAGHDVDTVHLLEEKLADLHAHGIHTLFIIDDAHLLDVTHLSALRLLLNLNEAGRADFSILLCGRTQLLGRLPQLEALDARVSVRAALTALKPSEVLPYLQHRLHLCGASRDIFTAAAAERLWQLSLGVPRRIHQLCDLALLVGMADDLQTLSALEIEAAAEELSGVVAPSAAA
jgi:general secretion pathway protein A